jgi:hypothetical protein
MIQRGYSKLAICDVAVAPEQYTMESREKSLLRLREQK